MGLVTLSLFSHTVQGLVAAVFLMLANGLVSPVAVTFLYERHHTRLVRYYRGMVITMPLFGTVMLTLMLANDSIPLSCNFVGEFFHYWGFSSIRSYVVGVIASFGTVLSAAYSIYLYNRVCFGLPSKFLCYSRDLNRCEFYTLFTLVTLIYLMGIFLFLAIDVIKSSVILQELRGRVQVCGTKGREFKSIFFTASMV